MPLLTLGALDELPLDTLPPGAVGSSGVTPFRFSEDGHITEPDDVPANVYFDARVVQAISYSRSLATARGFAGRVADANGVIRLNNQDSRLAALIDRYAIDGRQVRVLRRRLDQRYAAAEVVFNGTARTWTAPQGFVDIDLRDNLWRLQVPLQPNKYSGAGGLGGGDDLKDKPIPLCFGTCEQVPAVLVDASNLIYQVHDGRIKAILAVYDGGDLLTLGVHYTVDLANGRFTLLQSPIGQITADVQGSMTGGAYVGSTALIIRRILRDHPGIDAAFLDGGSFDAVEGATDWSSAEVGIWIGTEDAQAIDVVEELLVGVGGYLDCLPNGLITMGIFGAPWYGDTFALDESVIESIERVALPAGIDPPVKRVQAAYQRLWTGPQLTGLEEIVTADRRKFLALAYRTAAAQGDASGASIMASDPPVIASLFAAAAPAQAFAQFQVDLYGVPRAAYRIGLRRGLWQFRMNMAGRLTYPGGGWALDMGKAARVTAIAANAQARQVMLNLFV